MICPDCRLAAKEARRVVDRGDRAPQGALFSPSAMGRHKECKGGSWCDCRHQVPHDRKVQASG